MVLNNVHSETIRLIRDGENGGKGVWRWGKRPETETVRVYTYRYTAVTTRMTFIKMGSDESHFSVSLIVRDKVTRPCPQTTPFEEKGEPKRYRTEVTLPLTSLPGLTARPRPALGRDLTAKRLVFIDRADLYFTLPLGPLSIGLGHNSLS